MIRTRQLVERSRGLGLLGNSLLRILKTLSGDGLYVVHVQGDDGDATESAQLNFAIGKLSLRRFLNEGVKHLSRFGCFESGIWLGCQ
jgi:hypothetical protein